MTKRILFAADDPLVLKRLANALRDTGDQVDEAAGVPQLLALAPANRYDLAVTPWPRAI